MVHSIQMTDMLATKSSPSTFQFILLVPISSYLVEHICSELCYKLYISWYGAGVLKYFHNNFWPSWYFNTLRPRRNGRHFAGDIFKWIFLNENVWIPIKISLKFVPQCPNNNIPALVQIMAWRRPGDKSLSEPMMVRLPTHICVTQPQWVKECSCGSFISSTQINILVQILYDFVLHSIKIHGII